ncbi:A24 family peptidase [Corynebacterium sp. TAE3-ERU12]|uniref:prepilin peptidase n=1 Tax=Corynebacterium sp. TAE3-ERU12 TaxID=2849491 RepID=UPI001C473804|nr:A24 family peptidase [Corynebacterium sp. TAE3-ERU12]MBV7295376.1 A24 family peptidase [Corynebacterium sp. TAE3-ERU12]
MGLLGWTVWSAWAGLLMLRDLCTRRLDNWLTIPAIAVFLFIALSRGQVGDAVGGAVVWAALLLVPSLARPGGVGGGDIKLALALGLWAGAYVDAGLGEVVLTAAVATMISGLLSAGYGLVRRRRSVAHGPAMLLGAAVAFVF